jgi:hypothetical protein
MALCHVQLPVIGTWALRNLGDVADAASVAAAQFRGTETVVRLRHDNPFGEGMLNPPFHSSRTV